MQSIDSIETYAYDERSKDPVSVKNRLNATI